MIYPYICCWVPNNREDNILLNWMLKRNKVLELKTHWHDIKIQTNYTTTNHKLLIVHAIQSTITAQGAERA
jgi:hypothetical protein